MPVAGTQAGGRASQVPIGATSAGSWRATHIRCLQISRPPLAGTFPILHLYVCNEVTREPSALPNEDVIYTLGIEYFCYSQSIQLHVGSRGVRKSRSKIHSDGMPYIVYLWPIITKRGKGVEGRVPLTAPTWTALRNSRDQETQTSAIELQTDMHELCLHLAYYMIGNSGLNRAHHYTTRTTGASGRHVGLGRREAVAHSRPIVVTD